MRKLTRIIYDELFSDTDSAELDLPMWVELCKRRYPLIPLELRDIFALSYSYRVKTLSETEDIAEEFVRREYFVKEREGYMITEECFNAIREYHPYYEYVDLSYDEASISGPE